MEGGRRKALKANYRNQAHAPNPAEHTIHKHGFTQNEMKDMMENAGLGDFAWKEMPGKVELRMNEETPVYRTVFLARAAKN